MAEVKEPPEFESTDSLTIMKVNKVLKGARKTVTASRNYHRGKKILNSRVIKRSDLSSGIIDIPINMSNTLNIGVSQTASTFELEDDKMSQNEQRVPETKTLNSDNVSINRDSLESTAKNVQNGLLSFQSRENSLDYGEKIYNRRPLESSEFSNIDFSKETPKKFQMTDHYECISRNTEYKGVSFGKNLRSNVQSPSKTNRQIEHVPSGGLLTPSAVSTDRSLLSMQSIKNSVYEQRSKPVDALKSFPHILSIRNHMKEVKNGNFSDNENLNSRLRRNIVNTPNLNSTNPYKKKIKPLECYQSSTNVTLKKNIAPKASVLNIPKIVNIQNSNSQSPGMNIRNFAYITNPSMHNICPTYCLMPPAYRNVLIVPNQGFQTRYRYNIIGTASRDDMNITDNQKSFVEPSLPQRHNHVHRLGSPNTNYGYRFASVHANWRRNNPNFAYSPKTFQNLNVPEGINNSNFVSFGYTADVSATPRISTQRNEPGNSSHTDEEYAILNCNTIQDKAKSANCVSSTATPEASNVATGRARRWNETRASSNGVKRKKDEVAELGCSKKDKEDSNQLAESDLKIETPAVSCTGRNSQETKEEPKDESKLQDALKKLSQVYELLNDIHERFVNGFECEGLDSSLLIWTIELERCILSVEKIKNVVSEYEVRNTQFVNRSQSKCKK